MLETRRRFRSSLCGCWPMAGVLLPAVAASLTVVLAQTASLPPAEEAARTAWLRQHAFAVRTDDPEDRDVADLAPLKRMLSGVRVVGLGEQTHGTREFFRMKHRLVSFLVREMGFRTLAIEASQGGCEAIDDYVSGRSADRDAALAGQGFWMWDTEEMRALLDWMRAYNAGAAPARRVRFVGVDFQYGQRSRDVVLAYLRRVAPQRAAVTEQLIVRTPEWFPVFLSNDAAAKSRARQQIEGSSSGYLELLGFLTLNERDLVRQSSPADFREALSHARILAQYAHWFSPAAPSRDFFMADNLARMVEAASPGEGVVFWAHNTHMSVTSQSTWGTTGYQLRRLYGSGYFALGLVLGEGQFQSYDVDATPQPRLASFAVPPAPSGTLDWYFAHVGLERYVVDLRGTAPETVAAWLASPQKMRAFGTTYGAQFRDAGLILSLRPAFDGLLFIGRTTRARPV